MVGTVPVKTKVSVDVKFLPGVSTTTVSTNPTLLTVNWNPVPPPPPTVASATERTSLTAYAPPVEEIFVTEEIEVSFDPMVYTKLDQPPPRAVVLSTVIVSLAL